MESLKCVWIDTCAFCEIEFGILAARVLRSYFVELKDADSQAADARTVMRRQSLEKRSEFDGIKSSLHHLRIDKAHELRGKWKWDSSNLLKTFKF